MSDIQVVTRGMRDYAHGTLWGVDCVCVLSRLGKVASAATAATLIERFDVTHVVFTGVAGSADRSVKIGDIVIADNLVQHDMDTRPLFPRFEIPLTGLSKFSSELKLSMQLQRAAQQFLEMDLIQQIPDADRKNLLINQAHVHRGLIASGDEFISSTSRLQELKKHFPDLLAVEMEGAAVAQVCFEFGIPFSVIRTVSDGANEHSALNFMEFIQQVASVYAFHTMRRFCGILRSDSC